MENQPEKNLIFWFFLSLFAVSLYLLGRILWPFVSIMIMAAVVTGFFAPIYERLRFGGKIQPWLSSLLTCILVFLFIFLPISMMVGILSTEAYDLYISAKDANFVQVLANLLDKSGTLERINSILARIDVQITGSEFNRALSEIGKTVGFFLYNQARVIASNMLQFVFQFFLMLLIVYFLLIDGLKLVDFIRHLSPLPDDQDDRLIQKFKDMIGAVLIGNGASALIQGSLGGIIFAAVGIGSPFLWGVIMGLLAFLPIVGIGIVILPAAVFLFIKGKIAAGVVMVIFYIFLTIFIEYLFKPRLVGSKTKMHTLLVFLSMIGGLKLFGILGIIYGPLVATGFLTLTEIYQASYSMMVTPKNSCLIKEEKNG